LGGIVAPLEKPQNLNPIKKKGHRTCGLIPRWALVHLSVP